MELHKYFQYLTSSTIDSKWLSLLDIMVQEGYVNRKDENGLILLNYTKSAQYGRIWNEVTLRSRGLVLNQHGEVVSSAMEKFFNIEEHEYNYPKNHNGLQVFTKLDGSCIILSTYNDKLIINTRGSFSSDQALKARDILNTKYSKAKFNPDWTYIFEVIYPNGRIVVDYGNIEKLVLLAIRDKDCKDYNLHDLEIIKHVKNDLDGIQIVEHHNFSTIEDMLASKQLANSEGYVVRFELPDNNVFRLKFKFEEYIRLHRILCNISDKSIWELLKNEPSDDEVIEFIQNVPDEIYTEVENEVYDFLDKYYSIYTKSENYKNRMIKLTKKCADVKLYRKNLVNKLIFLTKNEDKHYFSLALGLYDGKSISDKIWELLEPMGRTNIVKK